MSEQQMNHGLACTVSSVGDLFMIAEARPFIDQPCHVVKVTKSGLVQVSLDRDPRQRYSVPKRNIIVLALGPLEPPV